MGAGEEGIEDQRTPGPGLRVPGLSRGRRQGLHSVSAEGDVEEHSRD